MADILLAFGADPAAKNFAGRSPADLAAKSGHTQLAAFLQATCAGKEARPAVEPYLEHAAHLDASLQEYTDKLGAALEAASARKARWWQCSSRKPPGVHDTPDAVEALLPALLKRRGPATSSRTADSAPGLQTAPASSPSKAPANPQAEVTVDFGAADSINLPGFPSACRTGPAAAPPADAAAADGGWPDPTGLQAASPDAKHSAAESGQGPPAQGGAVQHRPQAQPVDPRLAALKPLMANSRLRGWEGEGSQGTQLVSTVGFCRPLACITQALSAVYLVWRAARSCPDGWMYLYSLPVLLAELAMGLLANVFVLSMWSQLDRPARWLEDMMPLEQFPAVDVFIVTDNEPVDVVQPTCIAALNLNYPGSRLTVHVLDDSNSSDMKRMVEQLQYQARFMQRDAGIVHVARDKVKGVPHHAKAGNINSALMKAPGSGEFILVLDCDMVLHPDFLMRTLGHFYWQPDSSRASEAHVQEQPCPKPCDKGQTCADAAGSGSVPSAAPEQSAWVLKDKAAFVQTPQDFFNVAADDPLVHFARFFYGPMLQGRDGIGACPCCGTGVVFRRDVLVSIGGQAYESITEDYNTAMALLASGFSTMFLNERMVFGQAPEDLAGVFAQRLRWAMGALQILIRDNPLTRPGLTFVQSLLFWEAAAHHFLALPTIVMSLLPIIYMFTEVAPVTAEKLWEFCVFFAGYYMCNRLLMWQGL